VPSASWAIVREIKRRWPNKARERQPKRDGRDRIVACQWRCYRQYRHKAHSMILCRLSRECRPRPSSVFVQVAHRLHRLTRTPHEGIAAMQPSTPTLPAATTEDRYRVEKRMALKARFASPLVPLVLHGALSDAAPASDRDLTLVAPKLPPRGPSKRRLGLQNPLFRQRKSGFSATLQLSMQEAGSGRWGSNRQLQPWEGDGRFLYSSVPDKPLRMSIHPHFRARTHGLRESPSGNQVEWTVAI
jgi:hypothetical protein